LLPGFPIMSGGEDSPQEALKGCGEKP